MDSRDLIESQLRECFGRVVYSHKTHEKCADILLNCHKRIKFWQIVLSSVTTVSFVTIFLAEEKIVTMAGTVVSAILLCLNLYAKDSDPGELAQKHRHAAVELWYIREKYLSLITDLRIGRMSMDCITGRRDALLKDLHSVYSGAQSTNARAYKKAQGALQKCEEMTFSDDEIDNLLPDGLRKNAKRDIGNT